MNAPRVKICGITRAEDGLHAARAGADAIGLVFHPASPRYVTPRQAAGIVAALPPLVTTVGLFVDAAPDAVAAVLDDVPLDLLQFHGDESPAYGAAFRRPWIKALRMRDGADPAAEAERYAAAGARGLLVDSYVPGVPGGTGERFEAVSEGAADSVRAVRSAAALPGEPVLGLEYRRIQKGSFTQYHQITRDQLYPYLEKIGVRPVGQWQVLYLPNSNAGEHSDYDEVYTLTHYASLAHYQAVRSDPAALGGDGPDFQAMAAGVDSLESLSLQSSTEFLRGPLFGSPPVHAPPEPGTYRLAD